MKTFARLFVVSAFSLFALTSFGQDQKNESNFDPHALWDPLFYPHYATEFRSDMGTPGAKYWQNRVDYKIAATLDTAAHRITGSVEIAYKNNSPDDLPYLWLQLDQNIYRQDSRSEATQPVGGGRFANKTFTRGYEIKSVSLVEGGKSVQTDYIEQDTRMQIRLKNALKAAGGTITIKIDYAFDIPQYGTDRMGRLNTQNGWIYEIAQWYPRMSVYDDVEGWNTIPYLGAGEFYLDYGDIDYSISAPANMVIVGAGELKNPKDVLTRTEQDRLAAAAKSDNTVFIRTAADIADPKSRRQKGNLTWRFHMQNTRDVAWAASKAFIWDAAKINLPDKKTALAQSVYPVESEGNAAWGRSTEFTKACIERYSVMWYPFPYPVATNVAGIVGGMEYPGFVFCSYRARGGGLWGVTVHEFGHTWYPMIVGTNERKFPWMDEGFNTFINDEVSDWFNNGEFASKTNRQSTARFMFGKGSIDPIMTIPDVTQARNLGNAAYGKPAMGLELLREVIVGKDRFDYAFRKYTSDWAFKHPTPWDFFHAIDNGTGEELAWFWKAWFFENYKLDQAVEGVKYVNGDPSKGALITIENLDQMALPAIVQVKESNGRDSTFTLPVEIWQRGGTWAFEYPSVSPLKSVILDPNNQLPDVNSSNNSWSPAADKPIPQGVTAQSVVDKYLNAIGGTARLKAVKDLLVRMKGSVQGQTINFLREYKMPDKYKVVVTVPMMGTTPVQEMVVNGNQVSMKSMGNDVPLTDEMKQSLRKNTLIFPELEYSGAGYKTELTSIQSLDGNDVYLVKITSPSGSITTNYYDVNTGLKLRSVSESAGPQGKTTTMENFGDYKDVNGIKFPNSLTTEPGNGMTITLKVEELKVNSGLSDGDFK